MPRFASVVVVVASLVASGLGGISAASAGTLASTPHTWTDQHAPAPHYRSGRFFDVSCPTASFCMAVGARPDNRSFAEIRNSGHWRLLPVPGDLTLTDISCTSAAFCMATGGIGIFGSDGATAAVWDGQRWTAISPVDIPGRFSDVSCPTATDCTAVGWAFKDVGRFSAFAEHWNGSSWEATFHRGPRPAARLNAVACPSTRFCIAVGFTHRLALADTLVQRWNGVTWHEVTEAELSTRRHAFALSDVACAAPGDCTALGARTNGSLAFNEVLATRLQAGTWHSTFQTGPTIAPYVEGYHLSCESATNCLAVVRRYDWQGPRPHPVRILDGGGASWSTVTPHDANGRPILGLISAASCGETACTLVGSRRSGGYVDNNTKVWRLTGSLAVSVPNPTPRSRQYAALTGVSCADTDHCVAIGRRAPGVSLIEMYSNGAWQLGAQTAPALALQSVACPGISNCFAIGFISGGGARRAYIDRWNGSTWQLRRLGVGTGPSDHLHPRANADISCPSTTFCMAVGTNGEPFAASWVAGRGWRATTTSPASDALGSVSCTSDTFCLATAFGLHYVAAERWDGAQWTVIHSTTGGSSVACFDPTFCMLVGSAGQYGSSARWDGSSLTDVPMAHAPSYPLGDVVMTSIDCVSLSDCTAVGFNFTSYEAEEFVQRWDGTVWAYEPSVHASSDMRLQDVDCLADECTAVGGTREGLRLPFAERGV